MGATAAVRTGAAYPYDELDRLWKTVLLHQFHDILPGSSIAWVHREARATTRVRRAERADAARSSRSRSAVTPAGSMNGQWWSSTAHRSGARAGVPALGAAAPRPAAPAPSAEQVADGYRADQRSRAGAARRGRLLTSVIDTRRGAKCSPRRYGNLLQLHPDLPNDWDAWDVDSVLPRDAHRPHPGRLD